MDGNGAPLPPIEVTHGIHDSGAAEHHQPGQKLLLSQTKQDQGQTML